jgi:hypothetical protein
MMMITELTAQQKERLAQLYGEWLAAGKNCGPLDRDRVSGILAELYHGIGKPTPLVLFFRACSHYLNNQAVKCL